MTTITHVPPLALGDIVVPLGCANFLIYPLVVDVSADNGIAVVALRLPNGHVQEYSLRSCDLQRVERGK